MARDSPSPAVDPELHASRFPAHRHDPGVLDKLDAIVAKPGAQQVDQFGIVAHQDGCHLDHGDPGTEVAEGLGELDADRPAADHQQVLWQPVGIEDGLVGQVRHVGQTRDRWNGRHRSGRDHEAAGADLGRTTPDPVGSHEPGPFPDDPHTQAFEALDRIMRRDLRDDAADMLLHRLEVGFPGLRADAEHSVTPLPGAGATGSQDRLRGNAAVVQAVSAHGPGLEQHHPGTHLAGAGGDRQPPCPATNHAQVRTKHFRHDFLQFSSRLFRSRH